MHLQPVFAGAPARVDGTADRLFATGLCLPSGSTLTENEQTRVVEVLLRSLRHG
jgi:dTDP-4-amino-4,6-dideoxygalactose transaminase